MTGEGLGVSVVGAGRMGREHAEAATASGDRVVAVVDPDPAAAESLAATSAPAAAAFGSVAELLAASECADTDVVVVATPSGQHLNQVDELTAHGLDVLVEKPPWVRGQDAGPELARVRRRGHLVAVGMTRRFDPGVAAVRAAVAVGELGRLLAVDDEIFFQLRSGQLPDWYHAPPSDGGGVVMTTGVHAVDCVSWIAGAPLRVTGARLAATDRPLPFQDVAFIDLVAEGGTGDETGAAVSVKLLWSDYVPPVSRLQVLGTRGCAWVDGAGRWQIRLADGSGRSGTRPAGFSTYRAQWQAFRTMVRTGGSEWGALPELTELTATMRVLDDALTATTTSR